MKNLRPKRIGIDLDNTLIDYSNSARNIAAEEGFSGVHSVSDLRVRFKESDNNRWQQFQALLYTDGLDYATPADGSKAFLSEAKNQGATLFIVSHKTSTTPPKYGARDLRAPASEWLAKWDIVPMSVPENHVFFCPTQQDKVMKIRELNLDWFIDDLREVFENPDFPERTTSWLYRETEPEEAKHGDIPSTKSKVRPEAFNFVDLIAVLEVENDSA